MNLGKIIRPFIVFSGIEIICPESGISGAKEHAGLSQQWIWATNQFNIKIPRFYRLPKMWC